MTSWSTITMEIDKHVRMYTGPPTGLRIDKGNDECGWVDEDRYYALSYGRYQKGRYKEHLNNFDSAWFNGVWKAIICDVEDTGDTVSVLVYDSMQKSLEDTRIDGMSYSTMYRGRRFPDAEREDLLDRVEKGEGFRPVIEPVETTAPPDMMFTRQS